MANEKRLIDANALLRHKRKMSGADFGGEFWDEAVLASDIKNAPTVDAVEVRHGYWIPAMHIGDCCYRCSECQFLRDAYLLDIGNYCPNCGARMEGDDVNG